MTFTFSQNLISNCIKSFKEENGVDISAETANEYLNSMAGLFLAFAEGRPVPTALAAGGTLPVDKRRGDSTLGVSNT